MYVDFPESVKLHEFVIFKANMNYRCLLNDLQVLIVKPLR